MRSGWVFLALASISAVLPWHVGAVSTGPLSPTFYVKYDASGPFQWGNLSWVEGQGRIVWGPVAASTGGGGEARPEDELAWRRGDDYEEATGRSLVPYPSPDAFTSDPLPRAVFVNVTESILLDVQVQDNADAADLCGPARSYYMAYNPAHDFQLDAEIVAQERLVGGATGRNYVFWPYANPATRARPIDPPGHSTCRFALTPEAAVLERGLTLTLRLVHVSQDFPYTFAFGGDHPSTIRIPLLDPQEVRLRQPDVVSSSATPQTQGRSPAHLAPASPPALGPLLPGGVVGVAALASGRRRRTLATLAVSLTVGLAVSGCVREPGPATGEDPAHGGQVVQAFEMEDADGSASAGSVHGEVSDRLGIPVPGVHVSLLGTTDVARTDDAGRFHFLDLAPDTYTLRFDRHDYESFQADVQVLAGFVTKPAVTLAPVDATVRDRVPHVHDEWPEGVRVKRVMEAAITTDCTGAPRTCPAYGAFRTFPAGGDSNAVLPGTRLAEVTLTFSAHAMGAPELSLALYHASSGLNASYYAARASGVPFRVATSWEMTDPGHAPYSYWNLYWSVPVRHAPGFLPRTRDGLARDGPDLAATIDLHKGDALPVEPAHPDDWGGRTQLQLARNRGATYPASGLVPPGSPFGASAHAGKACLHWYRKVPPGTQTVEVTLRQSREAGFDWVLWYKPANVHAGQADYATWKGFQRARMLRSDGTEMVYGIEPRPQEADFVYARPTSTGWQVCYEPSDRDAWYRDGATTQVLDAGVGAGTATGLRTAPTLTFSMRVLRGDT